jgi:DegV family protein with EDD domain
MSKIAIVTDSTAYLPAELVRKYDLRIAPLFVIWDGVSHLDGVDIQPSEFYTRLSKSKTMPSSSQVTVGAFHKIFEELSAQGKEILVITISSKLSGTMDSAQQAKAQLPSARIELVDSLSTSMGMGIQVLLAARAAEAGATLEECKAIAEQARAKTGVILTVDTLEFLHRGGRIGGGSRFLGTALNIKPILELVDGKIEAVERVRTRGKALTRLIELVEQRLAGRKLKFAAVIHANATADAQATLDQFAAKLHPSETMLTDLSPVIGTHVGPGTIGLVYTAE